MITTIKIWEPRWKDRRVLLARYRIPAGQDVQVRIEKSAAKGLYRVPNTLICKSPIEDMKTRTGKTIQMRAIPLDEMERIEDGR